MSHSSKYLSIVAKRSHEGKHLEKVHRNMRNVELLKMAYLNLYGNRGATTPGTNPTDTIDGMSLARIQKLSDKLRNGEFQWTPVRRVYIPKANGKLRPLGIPNWEDKLVQEAIRLVLQAYYEPRFSNNSYGFRKGRGCHDALDAIVTHWTGTTWFIEGDIKGCFDNINHEKLLEILARDFRDERWLKLVRQMLEAGYLEDNHYHQTYAGTPQGGIASPILANIYLHELDKFVEEQLIPKYQAYTRGEARKRNPEYTQWANERRKLWTSIQRAKGSQEDLSTRLAQYKAATREMRRRPAFDPMDQQTRRLRYIRYADDFLLGYVGPKAEAEQIKQDLAAFIQADLKLDLSQEKTLITHAVQHQARFLGYEIRVQRNHTKLKRDAKGRRLRVVNGKIALKMPHEVLTKWMRKYTKQGKPIHRGERVRCSDYDIVTSYKSELTGIYEYYKLASNVSKLKKLQYTMTRSLTKTLAAKYKTSCSSIFRKYSDGNKELRVTVAREEKAPLSVTFGRMPLKRFRGNPSGKDPNPMVQRYAARSELLQRVQADKCELCGSTEKIEVHHINSIKKLKQRWEGRKPKPFWVEAMSAINRKTLVVCKQCHTAIHTGKYDGKRLSSDNG